MLRRFLYYLKIFMDLISALFEYDFKDFKWFVDTYKEAKGNSNEFIKRKTILIKKDEFLKIEDKLINCYYVIVEGTIELVGNLNVANTPEYKDN